MDLAGIRQLLDRFVDKQTSPNQEANSASSEKSCARPEDAVDEHYCYELSGSRETSTHLLTHESTKRSTGNPVNRRSDTVIASVS